MYTIADIKTGWVGGFDTDGDVVFESRPRLTHFSTTRGEWLTLVVLASLRAGIDRIEFVRGGQVVEVGSAKELAAKLMRVADQAE